MGVQIKRITSLDLDLLEKGCKEFYENAPLYGELDIEEWKRHWSVALSHAHGMIWAAIDEETGEALAALGGYIGRDQSNSDLIFTEKFFYATDKGKGNGLKLLRQAEEDLRNDGIARIYMIHLVNHEAERAARLYAYLGYVPAEILWVKEV